MVPNPGDNVSFVEAASLVGSFASSGIGIDIANLEDFDDTVSRFNLNKLGMNFKPNKHKLYLFSRERKTYPMEKAKNDAPVARSESNSDGCEK